MASSLPLLHGAALKGYVSTVRSLLERNVYAVNSRDHYGDETALHCACREGHLAVVRVLVSEFNANLNIRDKEEGWTPLYRACDRGHLDVIRVLVSEFKADISARDKRGLSVLHHVCNERLIDVIRLLVLELRVDLNIKSRKGLTPLHQVCAKGDLDLVNILLSGFKDLAIRDNNGGTPLHCACAEGHLDIVNLLVSEFKADLTLQDNSGWTPLLCACDRGHLGTIRDLVDVFKADPNVQDNCGRTGPMLAARKGHENVVIALLEEFNCPVNSIDGGGKSVVHYACASGCMDLVYSLIHDHQADINTLDKDGNTPLKMAAYEKQLETAHLLIKDFNCDPRKSNAGHMLLFQAIEEGNVSLVRTLFLVHRGYASIREGQKGSPLQAAASEGKLDIALMLINEFGCNPSTGNIGQTLLFNACKMRNITLLLIMLKYVSPLLSDHAGNTVLHLASQTDNLDCVKCLLPFNVPILLRNADGKSPIDLATGHSKKFLLQYLEDNKKRIRNHYYKIQSHAKKKYSGSQYITRMFILGYPGAGKSSLIESLKREGLFESFSKVSESSVPPHTAGIIPSVHVSKVYGRVLFYDFAGDAEYYSSHAAIFESLASSRNGINIFIVVVDLRQDCAAIKTTLHYWVLFIQYQKFSKISLIVVGSHIDMISKDGTQEKSNVLEMFCDALRSDSHKSNFFTFNCRDPRSSQIYDFKKQILSWISGSVQREISNEASLFLGLLERDFRAVTACPVQTLSEHINDSGVCLPTDTRALHNILLKLHEVGVLLLFGDHTKSYHHVVLNIAKLTNEVHELLFSDSAISNLKKLYPGFQSLHFNVGILPENILEEILPKYITKECLIHLQYCQQISHADVPAFPSLQQYASSNNHQSFLFFPALCSVDKSQVSWEEAASNIFGIGWLALCTDLHDYFPPRFLHVLLLRLVHSFTLAIPGELLANHTSPEYSRRCTMWKKGIHWSTEKGVDSMVEIVNENRGVVVYSKSSIEFREDCVDMFTKVISCVMEAKTEFCHSVKPQFFLLDSYTEVDHLSVDHQFAMSDVLGALTDPEGKNVILSVSGNGKLDISKVRCMRKLSLWNSFFPIDATEVLHFLQDIVHDVYMLGEGLAIPIAVLDALKADFPTSVMKRKSEMVWWWISCSFPNPACWWNLVQALQRIDEIVLAEKIKTKHGFHFQLQSKMLCQKTQALKPDEEFLESFSDVVGSKWPSLAGSLSLSEKDIMKVKENIEFSQKDLALQMLKGWVSREEATYGHLCHILNTVSLFQHST